MNKNNRQKLILSAALLIAATASAFAQGNGIAIAFDDMKTLQAHALMQAMHGGEYICNFEMGAKVDGIINAVLKSVKSGTWEKC